MSANPYNTGLDRNPANHQPLTPLTFLERAATVFPDHTAIVHGPLQRSYASFYARARQLASALADKGIGRGDTVSAMLPNTPAMLECHYGVPMCGGVLHSINTRLDAAIIAFQLDHAMSKSVIVDAEFLPLMQEALVLAEVERPLLESVMTHARGNQRHAAEFLGISRSTLYEKLKKYRIKKPTLH